MEMLNGLIEPYFIIPDDMYTSYDYVTCLYAIGSVVYLYDTCQSFVLYNASLLLHKNGCWVSRGNPEHVAQ